MQKEIIKGSVTESAKRAYEELNGYNSIATTVRTEKNGCEVYGTV